MNYNHTYYIIEYSSNAGEWHPLVDVILYSSENEARTGIENYLKEYKKATIKYPHSFARQSQKNAYRIIKVREIREESVVLPK